MQNDRICAVTIAVMDRANAAPAVNSLLSAYADSIVARLGVPLNDHGVSIISVIVRGSTDMFGALAGRLGQIDGIKVKTITV